MLPHFYHVHPLHLPSGHYPHDWGGVSGASRQVHHCGVHVSGLGITSVCKEIHWRVQTKGLTSPPPHQQCSNRICAIWWVTVILNAYVSVSCASAYVCMLLYYSFPKQERYISSIVNDATTSKTHHMLFLDQTTAQYSEDLIWISISAS